MPMVHILESTLESTVRWAYSQHRHRVPIRHVFLWIQPLIFTLRFNLHVTLPPSKIIFPLFGGGGGGEGGSGIEHEVGDEGSRQLVTWYPPASRERHLDPCVRICRRQGICGNQEDKAPGSLRLKCWPLMVTAAITMRPNALSTNLCVYNRYVGTVHCTLYKSKVYFGIGSAEG